MALFKTNTVAYYGIICFTAICYTIIFWVFPYCADDFWYMQPIHDYCEGIDTTFPWEGLKEIWRIHYQYDNIRTANIVYTFFLLLPRWIPALLSGIMMWLLLYYATQLAGLTKTKTLGTLLLTSSMVFLLPWYECMFVMCFTFNYVWATTMALYLLRLFIRREKGNIGIYFIIGGLVGSWHEGFAIPLLCGFILCFIINRKLINIERAAMILGLALGIIWLMSAPGTHLRYITQIDPLTYKNILSIILNYTTIPILIIITAIIAACQRHRHLLSNNKFIILFASSVIGLSLQIFAGSNGHRVGWFGTICSIIALIYILTRIAPNPGNITRQTFIFALSLLLASHLVSACYYTFIINKQYDYITQEYLNSNDGLVFAPITLKEDASVLSFKKPDFAMFCSRNWYSTTFNKYYSNEQKSLKLVPIELKNYQSGQGIKIDGNTNLRLYQNRLVAPATTTATNDPIPVKIDFGIGSTSTALYYVKFTAEDGLQYHFAYPHRFCAYQWFGFPIKSINFE